MGEYLEKIDFVAMAAELEAKRKAFAATPEGAAQFAEAERRQQEIEAKQLAEEIERPFKALADCGVPRRVVDTLRAPYDTKATQRIARWVDERKADEGRWCLVLSADKGTGKSVAAGLWMRLVGPRSVRVDRDGDVNYLQAWWPVSRFARMGGFDGAFDALCEHDGPVVLDDVGSEYIDTKGWFLQAFDALIDARYSQYRPTLITTNLDAAAFKSRYSERVSDRIREGGSYYEFGGSSMRKAAP